MLANTLWKFKPPWQNSLDKWVPPQCGFIKINYDGVSKGNPGQARVGGIFKNSQAITGRVYAMDTRSVTNN